LLEGKSPSSKPPYSKFYYSVEELAIRSSEAGTLQTICGSVLDYTTGLEAKAKPANHWYYSNKQLGYDSVFDTEDIVTEAGAKIKISPKVFLRWAILKDVPVNDKLQVFFNNECQNENTVDNYIGSIDGISSNERRELTRLRKAKDQFPDLINQAVAAALYAGIMCTLRDVTRRDLDEGVSMLGLKPLSIDLTDQIWKTLPRKIRANGRPENVPEPTICKIIRDARLHNPGGTDLATDEAPTEEDNEER
jgi:hypothetical protein